MEIWKKVIDERLTVEYEISNFGRIRNTKTKRILKPKYKRGYTYYGLASDKKPIFLQTHRMVLIAFKPIKNPEKYQVNHINHVRNDNRLDNLEWVTQQ